MPPDAPIDYDDTYRRTPGVFGEHPERILVDHEPRIERGFPVLDIGAGQGRNCLYLARRGSAVDALDPSRVALDTIDGIARVESLPITTHHGGFETHDGGPYAAVLVFGLVQILTWEGIELLARRAHEWLRPGGLLFVTAFTTDDDGCGPRVREWERIGRNSFRGPGGAVRTYLEPGELPRLFDAFTPIHLWEGLGPEHRHGDGPLERHALVEAVLRAGG